MPELTNYEKIKLAFPKNAELILKRAEEYQPGYLNVRCQLNAKQILTYAFSWDRTEEGFDYWNKLRDSGELPNA